MKKTIFILSIAAFFASCRAKIEMVGSLNMITTRNISLKESYTSIKTYANSSNSELRKYSAKTIDEAINNTLRNTPNGEFLMNVKVYRVGEKFAVSGDVWGTAGEVSFKGYKKGDHISWKDGFVRYTGIITELRNDKYATVKQDENGKIREVPYEEMQKID